MKDDKRATKSLVRDPRLEVYQPPKVVTMSSAQLLEQIGPAQGYGGTCGGGRPHGGRRGGRRGH